MSASFGHRSHFGSRYTSGCCALAGLFIFRSQRRCDTMHHSGATDTLAERLRRRPAKPTGSPRVGSNPTGLDLFAYPTQHIAVNLFAYPALALPNSFARPNADKSNKVLVAACSRPRAGNCIKGCRLRARGASGAEERGRKARTLQTLGEAKEVAKWQRSIGGAKRRKGGARDCPNKSASPARIFPRGSRDLLPQVHKSRGSKCS